MANYEKSLILVKEHLDNGENIKSSVYGSYEGKLMGNDTVYNGVFIATEKRVVFFAKKLFGYELESFHYKNISSIEKSKGMLGHTITIHSSGNKAKMKWIQKGDIVKFTQLVNSNIQNTNQNNNVTEELTTDIPSQIKKLSELKDLGILTDEEFLRKKTELLSKM
ncbi:PH domain-containing protein [Flavobacterium muglaense]|uniref:PH domain-containing protein n=1 Tax=Flavobacterium muglaense TaxID=2764716 RepID=A0A923N2I3_9FLAO|nr:PH domain-containing protein [Flavobacterium muglaense]MBC5839622.1 PH domain-containing protein [Flavobacterium muglaense]MBC5846156.1 PH domain-containing protein [Flavobacterium muglaense]